MSNKNSAAAAAAAAAASVFGIRGHPSSLNFSFAPTPISGLQLTFSSSSPILRIRSFRSVFCSSVSNSSLLAAAGTIHHNMDATGGHGIYPLHRCKNLHLVRHAQGVHNVEGEKDHNAYLSYDLFDAQLTPLGWQQVDNLRNHVQSCGLHKKLDLVIVSPLLRTMQTAVGVFGGEACTDQTNGTLLMEAIVGDSNRLGISTLNAPPFIAVELCREHMDIHPCDKRRSIAEYKPLFPAIDFSLIENDDDVLWKPDVREKNEEVAARGLKFLRWLWTRKEKEIAIVSHSGFLFHTLSAYGNDCHPSVKSEICTHFANCELRSVVIVDKSLIGSDSSSSTNYPGKIPHGLDLPSDVADEKHQNQ